MYLLSPFGKSVGLEIYNYMVRSSWMLYSNELRFRSWTRSYKENFGIYLRYAKIQALELV